MAFFNGWKKSKYVVVAILMLSLVATYALPMAVYAEDIPKPVESAYENTPQSEIDPALTNKVDAAQDQEKVAEDKAADASDEADKAADGLQDADKAANDADKVADGADADATAAEKIHSDGENYVKDAEKDINADVDTAVKIIDDKAQVADTAANDAKNAADAAARVKAEAATDSATAQGAANEADAAADLAESKAKEAATAYDEAKKTLDDANAAYLKAVADANTQIDSINSQVNGYQTTIDNLSLATLKQAYDDAEKATKDAAAAAKLAAEESDKAAKEAELAANAAMNYYVDPAKVAYDNALKQAEDANAAKLAAEKLAADKLAIEAQKKSEYDAIVPIVETNVKNEQAAEVATLQKEVDRLQKEYNDIPSWKLISRASKQNEIDEAKEKVSDAASNNTYLSKRAAALAATSQSKALEAAKADLSSANALVASKNADLANAQKAAAEKQAALNSAAKTRDDYLAEIKAAVGEEATAKILEALNKEVDASVDGVNDTYYDKDLYSWASDVKDDLWYAMWRAEYKDASKTVDQINTEYTDKKFSDWLNKTFPWIHNVKDTDQIIAKANEAYKIELKLHEEELATNQAYLAKVNAAKAAAEAAQKQADAANAVLKLEDAKKILSDAQSKLDQAKERVDKLEDLNLNTQAALDALDKAQDAVDAAKTDKDNAAADALRARTAADAAQKKANDLKDKEQKEAEAEAEAERTQVGSYMIQYLASGSALEVAASVEGKTTASSIDVAAPALTSDYSKYKAVKADNATLNAGGSVTINYADGGESQMREHMVTVWFEEIKATEVTPAAVATTHHNHKASPTATIAEEATPASPIVASEAAITPVGQVAVLDDAIPAGPLPKTGGVPAMILYGLGALLAGGGFAFKKRDKNQDEK